MFAPIRRDLHSHYSLKAVLSRVLLTLGAPTAIAVAMAGTALGDQTKPLGNDPATREIVRPNDAGSRSGRNETEFPGSDVHVAVEANAHLTKARVTYHHLQDSLNQAVRQLQYSFERSPELVDALKTEQSAWEDYLASRAAALKTVVTDPKYQANVALKNDMGDKIADVRATFDATRPKDVRAAEMVDHSRMKTLVTMAIVKLDYAQVVSDMEVTALKADSKVADTRTKLMTSGKHVRQLRDGFDQSFRSNAELASLRARIEDARIAFITAESFRDGAVDAANTALDYTYYKNRYGSNSYGYEYGYTVGYR